MAVAKKTQSAPANGGKPAKVAEFTKEQELAA